MCGGNACAPGPGLSLRAVHGNRHSQSLISEGTTISQLFTQDKWEKHRSVNRYFRHLRAIPVSTVFRRILKPCNFIALVAACICAVNSILGALGLQQLVLASVPYTLVAPALALLLVYRCNSAYARFNEGRLLWGTCVKICRDLVCLLHVTLSLQGMSGMFGEQARVTCAHCSPDRAKEVTKWIQVLPWLLKAHLRTGRTREDPNDPTRYMDDPTKAIARILGPKDSELVSKQKSKILFAQAKITNHVAKLAQDREISQHTSQVLLDLLNSMGGVIGGCERLLSTPMYDACSMSLESHAARLERVFGWNAFGQAAVLYPAYDPHNDGLSDDTPVCPVAADGLGNRALHILDHLHFDRDRRDRGRDRGAFLHFAVACTV
eukprot:scaffold2088_cov399-Prasinococcus_capsulatus_cf.AAC.34